MKIVKQVPPVRHGLVDWEAVASKLRSKPGEIGEIADVAQSTAYQISQGRIAALRPPEQWEATVRRGELPPGRATLYLKFLGDEGYQ